MDTETDKHQLVHSHFNRHEMASSLLQKYQQEQANNSNNGNNSNNNSNNGNKDSQLALQCQHLQVLLAGAVIPLEPIPPPITSTFKTGFLLRQSMLLLSS